MKTQVSKRRREIGWLAGISLFACLIRFFFLANGPGGWDDVDFALALKSYDIAQMQPHFPGYPIYLLVAHVFAAFIPNGFEALSFLSMVAAALTIFPLYLIVKRYSGARVALWACILWSVSPLDLVLGTQPLSDSFGTLLAMGVVASSLLAMDSRHSEKNRALALLLSGILLGLLYGVRISYLPFAAVPLWAAYVYLRDTGAWGDVIRAVACAVLVSSAWVVAMVNNVGGFDMLWTLATQFTSGHFSDWGGTYHEGAPLLSRATYWLGRQLFAAGMGTPWEGYDDPLRWLIAGLFLLAMIGFIKNRRVNATDIDKRQWVLIAAWVVPYLVWTFFAQNIEKPRHLLPLLPALLWLIAAGLGRWKRIGNGLFFLMTVSMLDVGLTPIMSQPKIPSPMVQLADYLANQGSVDSSVIYTYEEERVIQYMHPSIQTVRLRKWEDFQVSLLNYPDLPEHIYLTDSVLQGFQMPVLNGYVREVARFTGSEWLYPTYHDIVLYELLPEKKQALLHMSKLPAGIR
ncbi:glycosyltransferase family 39 protein [Brevibacillus ginsengisoli]|uniref:glycosyltransferase family 39 protein n=1 Tax=Brevibacillus ginsengisoli TaxID=363854 RepID=UPI003CEFB3CB